MRNYFFTLTVIIFTLFVGSCSQLMDSNEDNHKSDEPELIFSKMEIHYSKSGGWIYTSLLDINGNGLAIAQKGSSPDFSDSASTNLSGGEKDKIARLFESFSNYDSYYEPKEHRTDQNYHTIIMIYENVSDTVAVYDPDKANIPKGLSNIIKEMDSIWWNILN